MDCKPECFEIFVLWYERTGHFQDPSHSTILTITYEPVEIYNRKVIEEGWREAQLPNMLAKFGGSGSKL